MTMSRLARGGFLAALALVTLSFRQSGPSPMLWLAPAARATAADAALAKAVVALSDGHAADALPVFARAASDPEIGGYALLYMGRAQIALGSPKDAQFTARQLLATNPDGYLLEAALALQTDAAEADEDWRAAVDSLERLTSLRTQTPAAAELRLGRAAVKAGDESRARRAFARVYYEFALTAEAREAGEELAKFVSEPPQPTAEYVAVELGRAERLFGAARYADACKAYRPLHSASAGDDRQLIDLRLAECEFHLGRSLTALDALRPFITARSPRQPEAKFVYLGAMRQLKREDEYVALVREFVDAYPNDALAEAALNELGTYYILADQDEKAAAVFADQYRRFPQGVYAERAAWKSGWWAYKTGSYAEVIRTFESAAATMRRANYRPSWLYWSARAHAASGERDAAVAGFRQVIADYRNSYYGREAAREMEALLAAGRPKGAGAVAPASRVLPPSIVTGMPPPGAPRIQRLLQAGMYDEAIGELRRAQVESGPSPLIDATLAYALNRKGDLRPAITAMRRAYPQFMAAGGEALPRDILTVIFPVDYWDLIQRYAAARKLDPFLMTALIAQESTFQVDIRSGANAYGLMQVVPETGRRYARTLGIRPFSTPRLTEAETNIRLGMAYFSDLLREFGDPAPALAAYNAGEHRVRQWLAERPGLDRDEFIDDIPFPETQNYVKRVLGTAEDYRVLYRNSKPTPRTASRR